MESNSSRRDTTIVNCQLSIVNSINPNFSNCVKPIEYGNKKHGNRNSHRLPCFLKYNCVFPEEYYRLVISRYRLRYCCAEFSQETSLAISRWTISSQQ